MKYIKLLLALVTATYLSNTYAMVAKKPTLQTMPGKLATTKWGSIQLNIDEIDELTNVIKHFEKKIITYLSKKWGLKTKEGTNFVTPEKLHTTLLYAKHKKEETEKKINSVQKNLLKIEKINRIVTFELTKTIKVFGEEHLVLIIKDTNNSLKNFKDNIGKNVSGFKSNEITPHVTLLKINFDEIHNAAKAKKLDISKVDQDLIKYMKTLTIPEDSAFKFKRNIMLSVANM